MESLKKPVFHRIQRGSFHGLCLLVLILLCFKQQQTKHTYNVVVNRLALSANYTAMVIIEPTDCSGLNQHTGYDNECDFLKNNPQCQSGGFFYYLDFFYCDCVNYAFFGYVSLGIWLLALFYLLGNTSADYFCCCLEKLSNVLGLAPTVAGVTLLPLGNGAPDVFASIASFVGTENANVGLNSISGGAVFIICVVVGTISLYVANQGVTLDKNCFVRDVCTFLFAVVILGVILFLGEVTVGGAIAFVSIYVVYATFVAATEFLRKKDEVFKVDGYEPLLPLAETNEIRVAKESDGVPHLVKSKIPHWMWGSNVAMYSDVKCHGTEDCPIKPQWGWIDEEDRQNENSGCSFSCSKMIKWLEYPLMLTRRLTIPIIDEERWSKGYAVASVTLAPVLVAFIWNTGNEGSELSEDMIYIGGAVVGCVLGVASQTQKHQVYTDKSYSQQLARFHLVSWQHD
nr:cation/calcium exchanger 4-like [Tanacetum cinerariifolium]